jgi:hypothetical protein
MHADRPSKYIQISSVFFNIMLHGTTKNIFRYNSSGDNELTVGAICLSIYLWLYSPCEPLLLFQILNLFTVSRTPWTGDQP